MKIKHQQLVDSNVLFNVKFELEKFRCKLHIVHWKQITFWYLTTEPEKVT